jgi:hypothetical protein
MPELGYAPVNRYLPPRPRRVGQDDDATSTVAAPTAGGIAAWLGRLVKR